MPASSTRNRPPLLTLMAGANRPGEGHHLDPGTPCRPKRRGGRIRGRAARVDVVHEDDGAPRGGRAEGPADVATPFCERQAALSPRAAAALETGLARQLPAAREPLRKALRRALAAPQSPPRIGRVERDGPPLPATPQPRHDPPPSPPRPPLPRA